MVAKRFKIYLLVQHKITTSYYPIRMSEDNDEYEAVEMPTLSEDAIYDENEMKNLPTLFKDHLDDLPRLSIVAEGIYGPTSYNDVSSGQLLWMHTYSTQERVILREASDAKKVQLRHLSVPLDFKGKFCIVYSPVKKGQERTLREIIKGCQLPIHISFVRSEGPKLSTEDMLVKATNFIAIKEHQKHFFLANCILQEKPCLQPTVMMMEPDISICYLKGRKSMTKAHFRRYVDNMRKDLETQSTYDRTCGYPEIVEIYPDEMEVDSRGLGIPKSPNEGVLVPIQDYFSNNATKPPQVPPRVHIEKTAAEPAVAVKSKDHNNTKLLGIAIKKRLFLKKKPSKQTTPANNLPPSYEELSVANQDDNTYECIEDVVTLKITPSQSDNLNKHIDKAVINRRDVDCPEGDNRSELQDNGSCKVKNFTIEEVSQCLSLLGLDQFIGQFKKEKLDGVILSELNEDILKSEFSFSFTQAIRLMKFVREGHIPK